MAILRKKSAVPIYWMAVVWALWGLLLPLYTIPHWIFAAVVSLVVFFIASRVCKDRVIEIPDPPPEPVTTGNEALDALILERDRALAEMRRLNDNIKDETLSAQIDHLEAVANKILSHVVAHPQKMPQIRRFLSYYLPTTLKLLNAYDRMADTGVSGVNIDGTTGRVETMMDAIIAAFDKQLDALFGAEALDISTDIAVMEQMLAREGIGGIRMEPPQA